VDVAKHKGRGCAGKREAEADPRAGSDPGELGGQRPVELIEQREELVRRGGSENPVVLRIGHGGWIRQGWLHKVDAEKKPEGSELEDGGEAEKVAARQQ